jgi:uncharacterized membrane protein
LIALILTTFCMKRINSIDYTRGLVMVIMALDHVRDMMHVSAQTQSPTNLQTTTVALFFTRWITYLCAPTFVFLSGTSAYIVFKKRANISASKRFLLSRGVWLIVLEFTLVNFALWMDIHFRTLIMEVICAIGAGFIVLSLLLSISSRIIGIIGLLIIFGHNLMQGISFPSNPGLNALAAVLFNLNLFTISPNFSFLVAYPLIPWLGIMLVGFASGSLFEIEAIKRKRIFLRIGIAALLLFCLLRFSNWYGDPSKWAIQKSPVYTLLSFINVSKYPPSLLFVLIMLGLMFLALSAFEGVNNKWSNFFQVYGKVPLFYFILHLYLVHCLMFLMIFMEGFTIEDLQFGVLLFGRPKAISGIGLPAVYLVWIAVVALFYPACKWYGKYKDDHGNNWLLKYG